MDTNLTDVAIAQGKRAGPRTGVAVARIQESRHIQLILKSDAKMTSINFKWIVKEREKSRVLTGCLLA